MDKIEISIVVVLVVINLSAGFGFAIPLAGKLRKINHERQRLWRYFVILVGIYFFECIAFPAGMCTQVFSLGLAFVWGIILGFWLRRKAPARNVLKTTFAVSLYSTFPTVSFCVVVLIACLATGRNILNAAQGSAFGIPDFLPWPINTILGFFAVLLIGTVLLKTLITTGEVGWLIRCAKNPKTA